MTGRANYERAMHDLGIDCVRHPEIIEQPANAARVSGWFWNVNHLNNLADVANFNGVCGVVNCGRPNVPTTRINGYANRVGFYIKAKEVLQC